MVLILLDLSRRRDSWFSELSSQRLRKVDDILSSGLVNLRLHAKLLEEVTCLCRVVFDFKKCLNACSPLLRLPREIIREIITLAAGFWWPCFHDNRNALGLTAKPNSLG
jgi:hypothetical protein